MTRELIHRVTSVTLGLLVVLGLGGFLLNGAAGGIGVLAGGGLALANFLWLARGTGRPLAPFSGGRIQSLWVLGLGLRYLATFAALGILFSSGRVHPLAVVAGLTVLPPVLIACALYNPRPVS